jgi:hypothetical protein
MPSRLKFGFMMFLAPEELAKLTGRQRFSAQVRWLNQHGYRCEVNALGEPIVLLAEVERHLLGAERRRTREPDMSQVV